MKYGHTKDDTMDHYGLVCRIARSFAHRNNLPTRLDDMIQEGMMGVMRAQETFDPEKGFKFTTYAIAWIKQRIMRYLEENVHIVRLGTVAEHRRKCFSGALSEDYHLSLNSKVPVADHESDQEWQDWIIDEDSATAEELLQQKEVADRVRAVICGCNFNERDLHILEARHLSGREETLQSISSHLGVSKQAVDQRERKIIEKLRKKLLPLMQEVA